MRVRGSLFLTLALAGGLAASVRADDKTARKEIEAAYAKLVQAFKNKDVSAIMAMSTPDFTMKEAGRTMNAKQAEAELKQSMAMTKSLDSWDIKIDKLDVKGNKAVVTNHYTMSSTIADQQGKEHKMAGKGVDKDTLVKTPQGWKFKQVSSISESMTIDGKPFNPNMMAGPPTKKKK